MYDSMSLASWFESLRTKLPSNGACSPLYLPPEKVEVLCRCGRMSDMHVDTVSVHSPLTAVTQLEESLNSA